ncbi:MAG: hypothetical protein KatS3mg015_2120 [Fimbriimonadales bacterium]|nr:MAG: hypothetical protein KatS3mg015_2120 [Fimbriimonadales bacterium]
MGVAAGKEPSVAIGRLDVSLGFIYENGIIPIDGSKRGPNKDLESTVSRTFLTTLTYTASPKLWFDLVLPYKDTSAPKTFDGNENRKIWRRYSGMGDAILLGRYAVGTLGAPGVALQAVGGLRIPTGEARPDWTWTARNGEEIAVRDPVLQPGQGQWDPVLGLRFDGASGRVNWFGSALYRLSTGPNRYAYRFGSELQVIAGGACTLEKNWDMSLKLNYIHTDMDTDFRKGGPVQNTGGDWLYLTPGFRYKWDATSSTELSVMIPLYRRTNGNILNPEFVLNLTSSYSFDTKQAKAADEQVVSTGEEITLADHLVPGKWTLFEFWSETCATCQLLEDPVKDLVRSRGVALRKVDITNGGPVAEQFNVDATPLFILFDPEGKQVLRVSGDLEAVRKAIDGR